MGKIDIIVNNDGTILLDFNSLGLEQVNLNKQMIGYHDTIIVDGIEEPNAPWYALLVKKLLEKHNEEYKIVAKDEINLPKLAETETEVEALDMLN